MSADADPQGSVPPIAYGSATEPPTTGYAQPTGGYPPPQPPPGGYQQAPPPGGYYPQQAWGYSQPTYGSPADGFPPQVYYPGQVGEYEQPPSPVATVLPAEPAPQLELEDGGSSADEGEKVADFAGFTEKSIRMGKVHFFALPFFCPNLNLCPPFCTFVSYAFSAISAV